MQLDLGQGAQPGGPETEDDWEELPASFDIFSVPWQDRKQYRYEGPEIIYTFWAKHGPCQREGCGHRTPIMSTPVIAIKTLTVDAWPDHKCSRLSQNFRSGAPRCANGPGLAIVCRTRRKTVRSYER